MGAGGGGGEENNENTGFDWTKIITESKKQQHKNKNAVCHNAVHEHSICIHTH